jgi:hypothetical protein
VLCAAGGIANRVLRLLRGSVRALHALCGGGCMAGRCESRHVTRIASSLLYMEFDSSEELITSRQQRSYD